MFGRRKPTITVTHEHYRDMVMAVGAVLKWALERSKNGDNRYNDEFVKLSIKAAKNVKEEKPIGKVLR